MTWRPDWLRSSCHRRRFVLLNHRRISIYPSISNNVAWKHKPPLCHPACPGLPWNRSEVEGPAVSFCPSNLTAPNKSHRPPLCHPERTRISYFTVLPSETYAALRKESRMKSTEATVFDRKSGAAEGPAVRPGSRTKISVPLVLPQNRHPERSASPTNRLTQRLWRAVEEPVLSGVEGTPALLISPMRFGAFQPPKSDNRFCCDTHWMVTRTSSRAL
jgi:hypothetical protein